MPFNNWQAAVGSWWQVIRKFAWHSIDLDQDNNFDANGAILNCCVPLQMKCPNKSCMDMLIYVPKASNWMLSIAMHWPHKFTGIIFR